MIKNGEKVAIFIVSSGMYMLNYYNFDKVLSDGDFILIAIVNRKIQTEFNSYKKNFFSKVYVVGENTDSCDLCRIDKDGVDDVFKRELQECTDRSGVRIFAHNEYNIMFAAELREKYNIPGAGIDNMLLFRDKVAMKNRLLKTDVRLPKYTKLDLDMLASSSEEYFQFLVNKVGLPFIVKPTNGAGAVGVKKVYSYADLLSVSNVIVSSGFEYEVDEFINGKILHCDMVLKDDKPVVSFCSEYNNPLMQLSHGRTSGSMPILPTDSLHSRLVEYVAYVLSILKPGCAVTHTEVFLLDDSGEFVFLETAARAGGVTIIPMYERSFGVNLLDVCLAATMDVPYQVISDAHSAEYAFWALIPLREGVVKELRSPELDSQYELKWFVNVGDKTIRAGRMGDKAAQIYAWNKNYDTLKKDFYNLDGYEFMVVE